MSTQEELELKESQDPMEAMRKLTSPGFSVQPGRIIKAIPYTQSYEVQTYSKRAIAYGTSSSTSMDGQGASDTSCFLPGTLVLCYVPDSGPMLIISTFAEPITDAGENLLNFLTRATGSGIAEEIHDNDFNTDTGIRDCSGGSLGDGVPGDWGAVNSIGGAVVLTQFLSALKAGDTAGVWAYSFDRLLRIYGYNKEEFTSFTERVRMNDEGEAADIEYAAKYPWEALGLGKEGDAFKDEESGRWKTWKPGDSARNYVNEVEPVRQDQTGLWRNVKLRGYLGDMYNEYITHFSDKFQSTPIGYSDNAEDTNYMGLLQELKGSDGSYMVRSAKELTFMKYPLIPVPQQAAPVDHEAEGDYYKNYKASGIFGEGEEPKEQVAWDWGEDKPGARSGGLLDYIAYKYNWYHQANISEHKKDWRFPEEEELKEAFAVKRAVINPEDVKVLQSSYWANTPKFTTIDIDHRMQGIKYYEGMSLFSMQDDGSIILEDAWGSQLIMSHGNITLSPAGDLMFRPGKGLTAWAGGDIALRAGKSIDITSSKEDVRIKAEGNAHVLAGNAETYGGILLESRAKTRAQNYDKPGTDVRSSGVTIKCAESDFTTWASNITMSVKQLGDTPAGNIYFDADDGEANIITAAKTIIEDVADHKITRFKGTDEFTIFSKNSCLISSSNFIVEGTGVFTGGGLFVDGTIGGKNVVYDGEGPTMLMGAKDQIGDAIDEIEEQLEEHKTNLNDSFIDIEDQYVNNTDSPLNIDKIETIGFSLRTDEQYNIPSDFSIFASRWQQYIQDNGRTWEEPAVLPPGSSTPTYPHPGSKWQEDIYYDANSLENFNLDLGCSKRRNEYNSSMDMSGAVSPESKYKVLS